MIRIILADDETETRDNIVECIDWSNNGIEIAGLADNGEEALDMILALHPDIAILDISMPGISGLTVIERCRREMTEPPAFIIVSGYDKFTYAQKAVSLKVSDYILKPFRPNDLISAIRRAIWRSESEKSTEPNDFFSFLRICENTSLARSGKHSPYAPEAERKVLNAIAVGTKQDVLDSVDEFMNKCVWHQTVFDAANHFIMMYTAIHRLLTERIKNSHDWNIKTDIPWTPDNAYKQIDTVLKETACSTNACIGLAGKRSSIIMNAMAYIEKHYAEDITLDKVAEAVYVSSPYLSKLFREKTDATLTEHINKVRIEKAKELLLNPYKSISDIAEESGYKSESHFFQKFKQLTGMTPSQFRFRKENK